MGATVELGGSRAGTPSHAVSGRPYSGVNVLILWGAVIEGSYRSQDWLTFRQALAAGGCVRKGERGHTIFYADRFTPEDGREGGDGAEGEPRSIPFLKRFVVFNAAQCDGLPERLTADPTPLPPREQHEGAEALIAATDADFRIGRARAFYDTGGDYVQVPPLAAMRGMLAQQEGNFAEAADIFSQQLAAGDRNPHLRFNLAWAKAMLGEHAESAALLDDEVIAANPRGGTLKVQMLHYLGDLDAALVEGQRLAELAPFNQAMLGALAVVAFDAEDAALAAKFAEASPKSYDGLSTGGMLKLAGQDVDGAMALFERSLGMWQDQPRALLGKGLALLLKGNAGEAAELLERAAALFGSHLGSWVAAGWGHYTAGDRTAARRCFAKSLELDDTFAESHGSMAVLDIAEGKFDQARRGAQVAMRLDRKCLSGALATSLLAEHDQNPALAQKVRDRAMALPVGPNGETIAQALIGFGKGGG